MSVHMIQAPRNMQGGSKATIPSLGRVANALVASCMSKVC